MIEDKPDYSYVAFIDEAGDPGLKKVRPRTRTGASEWFIVSAALIRADDEANSAQWIGDITSAMNSPQMRDLHFAKLGDERKLRACSMLAEKPIRLFSIISNKQNMQGYVNPFAAEMTKLLPQDNWFYCWMTRVLLERVTDYVAKNSMLKYGKPTKTKLVFSDRGGLRYSQMHAYFELINIKSAGGSAPLQLPWGFVDFRCLDRDLLHVFAHKELPSLKMPDIAASSFFRAVDNLDVPQRDASFAKALEPIVASDPTSKMTAGYGVKLLPSWRILDKFGVPNDKREILYHYGYPQQWWQKVVEPGLV